MAQPTMEEIDRAVVSNGVCLSFAPRLEARYERDQGPVRRQRLSMAAFWFAVCYGLFLVVDGRLVADVFFVSAFVHLGIMVPLGFAVALITGRVRSAMVREGASALLTVASVVTILWIFLSSESPTAAHYHYLAGLPILYGNVVLRAHFPYAATASIASVGLYWTAMWTSGLPVEVAVAAGIGLTTSAGVTLLAGYHMERELRRAYLRKLRVEITADRLSHTNDELRQLSHLDTLTGIANRRWLEAHLSEMADRSVIAGAPLAVMMVDVDHFKGFNDHYGHPEGDRCLKMVATVARDQVRRKDDLIGRFGGEEFLERFQRPGLLGVGVAAGLEQAIDHLARRRHDVVGVRLLVDRRTAVVEAAKELAQDLAEEVGRADRVRRLLQRLADEARGGGAEVVGEDLVEGRSGARLGLEQRAQTFGQRMALQVLREGGHHRLGGERQGDLEAALVDAAGAGDLIDDRGGEFARAEQLAQRLAAGHGGGEIGLGLHPAHHLGHATGIGGATLQRGGERRLERGGGGAGLIERHAGARGELAEAGRIEHALHHFHGVEHGLSLSRPHPMIGAKPFVVKSFRDRSARSVNDAEQRVREIAFVPSSSRAYGAPPQ